MANKKKPAPMPISRSVQEKEKMTGLRIISNLTMLLVFVQSLGLLLLQYIGLCVMVMIQGRLLRFSGRVASCNKIHITCEACSDTVLITQYKKKAKQNKKLPNKIKGLSCYKCRLY